MTDKEKKLTYKQNQKDANYTFRGVRIVMVNTANAGNIGAAARACKNMGLSRLYLISPNNFPSAKATARASHADDLLASAVICNTLIEAISNCHLVIATSARHRRIEWQQMEVKRGCELIMQTISHKSQEVAVVFGPENAGLSNKELDLCQVFMNIPTYSHYTSLNVAQAVQVFAYQLLLSFREYHFTPLAKKENITLASVAELDYFYTHLEIVLDKISYLDKYRPNELLMRRLKRLFSRRLLEKDELSILRGVLTNIEKTIQQHE